MQTGVCWDLEGCVKAGSAGRTPSLHCRLHVLGMPIENLTLLKFRTVKFPTIRYATPVDPLLISDRVIISV